jgi:hypothetical protein
MGDQGGLLTLADIYGLSNPGDLPMVEAPVRMAAVPTVQTDADGFPVGSTADIVAAGRAAVNQARQNVRTGVQPDPSVYDDQAAAREGPAAVVPVAAPDAAGEGAGAVAGTGPGRRRIPSRQFMEELYRSYPGSQTDYTSRIQAASDKSRADTEAFKALLEKSMVSEKENAPSKAEMYFRLAAAFGAPSKTGNIFENVSMAAKELGEYSKDTTAAKRAAKARNLELMMKGQELSMRSSKEELDTLRGLSAEENKERRQFIKESIDAYIKSGEPQSAAGKQSTDEGFIPGTPEHAKRTREIGQTSIDAATARLNASMDQRKAAQEAREKTLSLAQQRLDAQQAARKQAEETLSVPETRMKLESEDKISTLEQAKRDLDTAFRVTDKAFDASLHSRLQRTILENTMPKDKKVEASELLEQALKSNTISSAADKMKGVLSDTDIKLLLSIQGLGAKSMAARKEIIMQGAEALQRGIEKERQRLADIASGKYRQKTKEEPKPEGGE